MPELPEVETVRRGLAPVMEGVVIELAEVNRPDLRWPFPESMAERLTGKQILQLRRRSKYILADLDSGETLLVHLGMSGRMTISGHTVGEFHHPHPTPAKHDHVVFHMANGVRITFNDARRFGAMDLMAFVSLADQLPTLQSIKDSPLTAKVPDSAAAICMVVYRTLAALEKDWLNSWMDYLPRLDTEAQAMFANGVRVKKYSKQSMVMTNKKFTDWAMEHNHLYTTDKK